MADCFWTPELTEQAEGCLLEGPELHHLRTVLRAKVGTELTLLNGAGLVAVGRIESLDRDHADIRILHRSKQPDPAFIELLVAFPKGDRADLLVEKCVELGVRRLTPIVTTRTIVNPSASKLERLRRLIIEACKQSHRPYPMQLDDPLPWLQVAAPTPTEPAWLLHPGPPSAPIATLGHPTRVAIGPEGGWTEAECAAAVEQGWQLVRLPTPILRIETAAIAIASWQALKGVRHL